MDTGDVAHVVLGFEVGGGFEDVFAGELRIADGLEVETEIKVGVEELIVLLGGVASFRRSDHVFWFRLAAEEREDLHHRNAGVAFDRDESSFGFLGTGGARDAEEMPDGVLDVVRIHGLVRLELLATIFKATGVVERDAALPVMRRLLRNRLDELVKVGDGFRKVAELEVEFAALLEDDRGLGIRLQAGVIVRNGFRAVRGFFMGATTDEQGAKIFRISGEDLVGELDCLGGLPALERGVGSTEQGRGVEGFGGLNAKDKWSKGEEERQHPGEKALGSKIEASKFHGRSTAECHSAVNCPDGY